LVVALAVGLKLELTVTGIEEVKMQETPEGVKLMLAVPTETPVTKPVELTVATAVLSLAHVPDSPAGLTGYLTITIPEPPAAPVVVPVLSAAPPPPPVLAVPATGAVVDEPFPPPPCPPNPIADWLAYADPPPPPANQPAGLPPTEAN
jgi:hypothetical protein